MRLTEYLQIFLRQLLGLCLFLSFVTSKEDQNKQDHCKKENSRSACIDITQNCIELSSKTLGPEDPSWFIIVPRGRLGNHIVGYSIIQALGATLNIRPLISQETETYLKKYFDVKHNISIFEETFCNVEEIEESKMIYFEGSIDQLVQDKRYHK